MKMVLFIKKKLINFVSAIKAYFYLISNNLIEESKIFTHLTNDEKAALNKISRNINVSNPIALEIGSYLGSSSCFIANGLKKIKGTLYCIDTWQNNAMQEGSRDTFSEFLNNTKNYKKLIVQLQGWSHDVIENFKNLNKTIDLLFIDGDHSYEGCKTDWLLYSFLLSKNAIAIFHDTGWAEGVQRVINEMVTDKADLIVKLPNMQIFRMK